ncbi:sensor histidine kinase/response regulator [gamma proteobacterium HdN1]|nr:sensor histidine kinase/response regulator [gamma proteobacterium HdN1]
MFSFEKLRSGTCLPDQWLRTTRIFLAFLLLFPFFASGSTESDHQITLTSDTQSAAVGTRFEFLTDPSNRLNLAQVRDLEWKSHFSASKTPNFSFSYDTIWLHFTLATQNAPSTWIMDIANPQLDRVDVYLIQQGQVGAEEKIVHLFDGDTITPELRPALERGLSFPLSLERNQVYDVYISTYSNTTLLLPITFSQPSEYKTYTLHSQTLLSGIYGCIAGLLLYNLVLGYITRDTSYYLYVHYVAAALFFQLALSGIGSQLLWGDMPWMQQKNLPLSMGYANFAAAIFVIKFLDLRGKSKWACKSLMAFGVAGLATAVSCVVLPEQITVHFLQGLTFFGCLLILTITFVEVKKGKPSARIFGFAWLPLLLGTIVTVLYYRGFLPRNLLIEQSQAIGVVMEMVLLSLALAKRIEILQRTQFEAHAALEKAEQETRIARHNMRAKSNFLAMMSHEIRTPMNGVIGISELLSHTQLDSAQQRYVSTIRNSGEALLRLVNDILDFSKLEARKLTLEDIPFHLPEMLQECVDILTPKIQGSAVDLRLQISNKLPKMVNGDPTRLRQIILNLGGNALKFTRKGHVTIAVSFQDENFQPHQSNDDLLLRFTVSDTGIGLTEEQIQRLFQPFQQAEISTARQFGGTGLGLVICKDLAELMGGSIGVHSISGEGATFWFTARLSASTCAKVDIAADTAHENSLPAGLRIMVADDNRVNQLVLSGLLHKLGVDVLQVDNGEEVIRSAEVQHDTLDLILMDCEMPIMSGFEATRLLREQESKHHWPRLPIIALTGHSEEDIVEQCRECGMDAVLTKPVTLQQLHHAIYNALGEFGTLEKFGARNQKDQRKIS